MLPGLSPSADQVPFNLDLVEALFAVDCPRFTIAYTDRFVEDQPRADDLCDKQQSGRCVQRRAKLPVERRRLFGLSEKSQAWVHSPDDNRLHPDQDRGDNEQAAPLVPRPVMAPFSAAISAKIASMPSVAIPMTVEI